MTRQISLKRLSASDLTFFDSHYRKSPGAKQKAINLDADVFVNVMFPGLPRRLSMVKDRVVVSMSIYGPAGAAGHHITRKILKQQKNWRLNGELVVDPPEEPGRYEILEKGDYAVMSFSPEPAPDTVKMYLVSRTSDSELFNAIESKFGSKFNARRGMHALSKDMFGSLLQKISLYEGHPIFDLIDDDLLEDAAQGGFDGIEKLNRHRRTRGVTREELLLAQQNAGEVGRLGEEIVRMAFDSGQLPVDVVLGSKNSNYVDEAYMVWEADLNAIAPFDFRVMASEVTISVFDVKSTRGGFGNALHLSLAEIKELAYSSVPYDIYRVYEMGEESAKLRICRNPRDFALSILSWVENSPELVTVDSLSVKPVALDFGDEIQIDLRWI